MTRKILVIDDERDLVELLSSRLRSSGFEVATAKEGLSGIEKAKGEQPDLIVLDLMMPEMDGYEVAKRLKRDKVTQAIPIVFLTAAAAPDLHQNASRAGAQACLTKPFEAGELLEKIEKILSANKFTGGPHG